MAAFDVFQQSQFTTSFTAVMQALLQQETSLFRSCVDSRADYKGKAASVVNQIGAIAMQSPAGRFTPKNRTDPLLTRRWVFPKPKELVTLIDQFDLEETIVDPKAFYVQDAVMACSRAWDDEIISAAFGTAQVGQDPQNFSAETFNTNSTIAATPGFQVLDTFGSSSTSGLTIEKMIEAERVLYHYHNSPAKEPWYWAMGSQQYADLKNQVQFVSTEFRDRAQYDQKGMMTRFMDFNLVITERLPTLTASGSGATCRENIVWTRSGLHLGIWMEMRNKMVIADWLSGDPYQMTTQAMFGATRTQQGKVLQVLCHDTTGGDITV